jgi:hypothetical protein
MAIGNGSSNKGTASLLLKTIFLLQLPLLLLFFFSCLLHPADCGLFFIAITIIYDSSLELRQTIDVTSFDTDKRVSSFEIAKQFTTHLPFRDTKDHSR